MKLAALLAFTVSLYAQTSTGGLDLKARLNAGTVPFVISIPNSSTGTTNNKLAMTVNTGGVLQVQTITTSAGDRAAVLGCVISGGGTSGSALVMVYGTGSCHFDGATTANNVAVPSSTSAGALHDTGSSATPTTGAGVAVIGTTNACGSPPCLVTGNLFAPLSLLAPGSGGPGGGGGNGNRSFQNINSGTNSTAALVVGSGSTLVPTGSGTIQANAYTANTVNSAAMAVVNTRRVCSMLVGADNASAVLADADIGPQNQQCKVPFAATIVEVDVNADAGTPSVIVRKKHCATSAAGVCTSWTSTDFLSGALSAAASNFDACSNTGGTTGLDAVTTCSGTLQNTGLAIGDWIELKSGTAGGTAKRLSVDVIYTVN